MCTYADHVGPHLQSTENELLCLSKILYQDFSPYLIQYSHTHTHTHIHTHSCPSNSFIISIMCTYSYFINLYTYFIPRIRSLYSTFLTHQWFINLHFINFHFINLYILYISNSFTILFWHTNDSLIFISQICNSQILAHERSLEKVITNWFRNSITLNLIL